MDYAHNGPIDHYRTTRRHAGETLKNGANAPGMGGIAAGSIALVVGLAAFATGRAVAGALAMLVAAAAVVAGLAWLRYTHRQVRFAEQHWHAKPADHGPASPTS